MGTLVRAITAGFANGSRVRAGQEFELPDGVKPGKWLEKVKPSKPKVDPAEKLKAEIAKLEATREKASDAGKLHIQTQIDAKKKELEALAAADDLA